MVNEIVVKEAKGSIALHSLHEEGPQSRVSVGTRAGMTFPITLPREVAANILIQLQPHRCKILSRVLGFGHLTESLPFCRTNLAITKWVGVLLKKLNWDMLGTHYVAALLSSVPVCHGLLYIICPELLVISPNASEDWEEAGDLAPPCRRHRKMILDAIDMLMDEENEKEVDTGGLAGGGEPTVNGKVNGVVKAERPKISTGRRLWESCRHPSSIGFLCRVGASEALFSAFDTLNCDNSVEGMLHAVRRNLGLTAYIINHPASLHWRRQPENRFRLLASYALCGEVEKLFVEGAMEEKPDHVMMFNLTQEVIHWANKVWNPQDVDGLDQLADGLCYLLSSPKLTDHDVEYNFKYLMLCDIVMEPILRHGELDDSAWQQLVQYGSAFAIRQLDKIYAAKCRFLSWLLRSPENSELVERTIWRCGIFGRKDVLEAWLDHSIIKNQSWFGQAKQRALHSACRYGHLEIVVNLLDRYGVEPNTETFVHMMTEPIDIQDSLRDSDEEPDWWEPLPDVVVAPKPEPAQLTLIMKKLLSKRSKFTIKGYVVSRSCQIDQPAMLQMLLNDSRFTFPKEGLHSVVYLQNMEIYKVCQARRPNFSARLFESVRESPKYIEAMMYADSEVLETFQRLPQAGDVDRVLIRLCLACRYGDLERVEMIFKPGMREIFEEGAGGSIFAILLMTTVEFRKVEIVKYLLSVNNPHFHRSNVVVSPRLTEVDKAKDVKATKGVKALLTEIENASRILSMFLRCKNYSLKEYFDVDSAVILLAFTGDQIGLLAVASKCGVELELLIPAFAREIIIRGCKHLDSLKRILKHPKIASNSMTDAVFWQVIHWTSPVALEMLLGLDTFTPSSYTDVDPFVEAILDWLDRKRAIQALEQDDRTAYWPHLENDNTTEKDLAKLIEMLLKVPEFDPAKNGCEAILLAVRWGLMEVLQTFMRDVRSCSQMIFLDIVGYAGDAPVVNGHEILRIFISLTAYHKNFFQTGGGYSLPLPSHLSIPQP
ncbi:hypothetical protein HDU97_005459 [Phlyctochytrium planicorne]|nr:hypothetical protein HDU97_005459 [Phlyctochytrium planicorne]